MSNEKARTTLGRDVLLAVVSAFLAILGSIFYFHYTSTSPDLVYEASAPALFTKNAKQIGIYRVKVENAGSKEVQDVQVYLELSAGCIIQGITVEPKPKSVAYIVQEGPPPNCKQVNLPLLNPGDTSTFSILADSAGAPELTVQVRGKGISGHPAFTRKNDWIAVIALMLSIAGTVFAAVMVVALAKSVRKSGGISDRLSRVLDKQIRLVSMQDGKKSQQQLEEVLLGRKYRLFYNPAVPGLSKTKIVRFGTGGTILEGQNKNEASWRIRNELLEFLNSEGRVYSRFDYNQPDDRFENTNDTDTLSIRDQFILPEA